MKKNILYRCIALLIAVILFIIAQACNQCKLSSGEEMSQNEDNHSLEEDDDIDLKRADLIRERVLEE